MIGTTNIPGEFRQAALSEPVLIQPGDTVRVVGNQVIVTRNNAVVAVRLITGEIEAAPVAAESSELLNRVLFFWRPPVAGTVVTLIDVTKNTSNGSVTFKFSNGNNREFAGLEQAVSETNYIHTEPTLAEDILIAKSAALSPDGTNLHQLVGVKCAVDVNALQPVTVQ
jgi:hypothetical protein